MLKPAFASPRGEGRPFAMWAPHSAAAPSSGTGTTFPFTSMKVVRAKPASRLNAPGPSFGVDAFRTGRGAWGFLNMKTAIGCGASSFFAPAGVKRAWTG